MRHVIDFGNFEDGAWVITTGQSGRWPGRNYDEQAYLWHDMEYLRVPMDREVVENDAIGRTVFVSSPLLP